MQDYDDDLTEGMDPEDFNDMIRRFLSENLNIAPENIHIEQIPVHEFENEYDMLEFMHNKIIDALSGDDSSIKLYLHNVMANLPNNIIEQELLKLAKIADDLDSNAQKIIFETLAEFKKNWEARSKMTALPTKSTITKVD